MVSKFVGKVTSTFSPPPQTPTTKGSQENIPGWILELEASGLSPSPVNEVSPVSSSKPYIAPKQPSIDTPQPDPPVKLSPAEENLISTPQKEIDAEALTKFVLQEIKHQRRQSDIIETICKRTGWHWNEAQLFVARARTTHHGEITKSQSRFMIPFSVVFIAGGVLLLIWSSYALADYYLGFTSADRTTTLAADFIPLVFGALITSFGIIAGGIFGLYRTLASR
jgi:hypothetical protein